MPACPIVLKIVRSKLLIGACVMDWQIKPKLEKLCFDCFKVRTPLVMVEKIAAVVSESVVCY